jgi:plastocyanin
MKRELTLNTEREASAGRATHFFMLLVGAALACSCGGSSSTSSTTPSDTPSSTNTMTITASGISPKNIVVSAGSQVTFVNNDTVDHEPSSDPHPEHTDCPDIDAVFVVPGQSRQTKNLITKKVCGIHDHLNPGNNALKGTITIQ